MAEHKDLITPPLELVREWAQINGEKDLERFWMRLATQAARWGADLELKACCEWVQSYAECGDSLRAIRRPKPPSLAEEALDAQERMWIGGTTDADWELIRRALERLQHLEQESNDN